jgi:hypothetical protein
LPRSCGKSSTFRGESEIRIDIMTASRVITGLALKW